MKKLLLLLFVGGMTACSVESVDSTNEEFFTAEMKGGVTAQQNETFNAPELICAGEAAEFCVNFPQATKGNGDPLTTNIQVQLYDEATDEWIQIFKGDENTEACFSHIFAEAQDFSLRYKIGGGGFTETSVTVEDCVDCEESFSYVDNGDKSYTFTYVPAEDITDAGVVFTFAQGVSVSGLEGWENHGQTIQKTMDLSACEVYTWTVGLEATCSGSSPNSNVWTDFKVNDVSKKANEEDKFTQSCN